MESRPVLLGFGYQVDGTSVLRFAAAYGFRNMNCGVWYLIVVNVLSVRPWSTDVV